MMRGRASSPLIVNKFIFKLATIVDCSKKKYISAVSVWELSLSSREISFCNYRVYMYAIVFSGVVTGFVKIKHVCKTYCKVSGLAGIKSQNQ